MSGAFALWQPEYAAHGLATFPVRDKRPAVSNYLRMGLRASNDLARKFANDEAFGIACKRSKLAVVDIDAPDERLLAAALGEFGETPFIVRTASGGFHAWYRHNGEARKIRPDPELPIDILGDGFVVAPPSVGSKGAYEIIGGSLDDLDRLPVMRRPEPRQAPANSNGKVEQGRRNQTLWRECMQAARTCPSLDEMISFAVERNIAMLSPPLPDAEVVGVATSAWNKEMAGQNWFGSGGRVVATVEEVDGLLFNSPDALLLLFLLRRQHWGHPTFQAPNELAAQLGWGRKRFADARSHLVQIGELVEVRPPSSFHGAAIFRFKGGRF